MHHQMAPAAAVAPTPQQHYLPHQQMPAQQMQPMAGADDVVFVVEGSRHDEINGGYRRQMVDEDGKPDEHLYIRKGCEQFPRVFRAGGQWQMVVETKFLFFKGTAARHTKWPSKAAQPPLTGWGSGVTVRYV